MHAMPMGGPATRWRRTMLALGVSFAAVALGVVLWFPAQQRGSALRAQREDATSYAELTAYAVAPAVEFGDAQLLREVFAGAARHEDFVGVTAIGPAGREIASRGELASLEGEHAPGVLVTHTPIELGSGEESGTLVLVISTDRIDEASRQNLFVAACIAGLIVVLGFFVSFKVSRAQQETERLLDENALARQAAEQASEVKSRLLANTSHELRTPLNGIMGLADALGRHGLPSPSLAMVHSISRCSRTLLSLVNDLLDLSRIEAGSLELEETNLDPEAVVLSTAELFAPACRQRGVELVVEVDEGVPREVSLDGLRFEQVMTNLLGNATKFTSRGRILVRLSWLEGEAGHHLRLSVADTGVGIAEEHLETIFEAFTQADVSIARRFGGSGLGLSIGRRLASLMGGTLSVTSVLGEGSTFCLEVPSRRLGGVAAPEALEQSTRVLVIAEPKETAAAAREREGGAVVSRRPQPGGPWLEGLRFLVAEDDETNQMVMRAFLDELGADSTIVWSGAEAVEAWRGGDFDIVLMDCQMSDVDGHEATRQIRSLERQEALRRVPIVAVTADVVAQERARAKAAGMDGYLTKPITLSALARVLREHIDVEAYRCSAAPLPPTVEVGAREELASAFERCARGRLERLADAYHGDDLKTLRHEAHALKGSCYSVGAQTAAAALLQLEGVLDQSEPEKVGAALFEVEVTVEQAVQDMLSRLEAGARRPAEGSRGHG